MKFTNMIKKITLAAVPLVFVLGFAIPTDAATCDFNRNLKEGTKGEDVRCLQQYLNSTSSTIATTGAGSSGKETDEFRTLTKLAVMNWQSSNGLDNDGIFGPGSQAKYTAIVNSDGTPASNDNTSLGSLSPAELEAYLLSLKETVTNGTSSTTNQGSTNKKDAEDSIKKALVELDQVEDAIDDAEDDGRSTKDAKESFHRSVKDMLDAMRYFLDGNYDKAVFEADDSYEKAQESFDETGEEDKEKAEKELDDIKKEYRKIKDDIEDADDYGDDVDRAYEYLFKADDFIDLADDSYDRADYDDALDYLDDAQDELDEVLEELDQDDDYDKEDAEDAIDDAKDAIRKAKREIERSDNDGDDVKDAEDILDDAEKELDDAENEFDDRDYNEAFKDAQKAERLAEDAEDEL